VQRHFQGEFWLKGRFYVGRGEVSMEEFVMREETFFEGGARFLKEE